MKVYNSDEIIAGLFSNKKYRAKKWDALCYIESNKNGQIVNNKGEAFNINDANEHEWVIWTKPKPLKLVIASISKQEALSALYDGKSVKVASWVDKRVYMKEGQVVTNDGELFNIMLEKSKEWIIIEDEVENLSLDTQAIMNELSDLKNMLKYFQPQAHQTDGRSKEATATTSELLEDVYGVSTPAAIQKNFFDELESAKSSRDVEQIVCQYIPYCWIGGRTLGTTSVYYSNMRNVIKDLKNETYRNLALELFLPPQKLYETVQMKISDNKKEDIRDKNVFDKKHVKNLIVSIKEKIQSDNYSEKPRQTALDREKAYYAYSYLTIVTGRRQSEILKTLEIKNDDGNIEFCGILKDKEDGKCIDAFSLDDDFDFQSDLLDYIHAHINSDKFTEKQINGKFNHSFNNALKRITSTDYTAKNWRDIYAEMMWIKSDENSESTADKRDFKAKVLGHEYDGRLTATEHYDAWESIDE
ncbi:MAG: hypothetical protein Q9M36_02780 [Sulfurovum sp.]|nr:hypothetical protein [Sulfurovum sp.]